MNKRQKMIKKMWNNYTHNCDVQGVNPLYNYRVFRNCHSVESFEELLKIKNWYRDVRI